VNPAYRTQDTIQGSGQVGDRTKMMFVFDSARMIGSLFYRPGSAQSTQNFTASNATPFLYGTVAQLLVGVQFGEQFLATLMIVPGVLQILHQFVPFY